MNKEITLTFKAPCRHIRDLEARLQRSEEDVSDMRSRLYDCESSNKAEMAAALEELKLEYDQKLENAKLERTFL